MDSARGKAGEETITRLADRIDSYEKYSRPHSRVMAELAARLARRMGLPQHDVNAIVEAAMLHDIGLQAMNPPYHSSSRQLSLDERLDLWRHPVIGEQQMARRGAPRHAQLLVRWHHECWNGSGYPDGLSFEDIPIGARILRAVELLSALVSDRPYRAALSDEKAIESLEASAGVECDPYVIASLLVLIEEICQESDKREAELREAQQREAELLAQAAFPPVVQPSLAPIEDEATNQEATNRPIVTPRVAGSGPLGFPAWPYQAESDEKPPEAQPQIGAYTEQPPQSLNNVSETTIPVNQLQTEPEAWTNVSQAMNVPPARILPAVEKLITRGKEFAVEDVPEWRNWGRTRYNRKSLLGFEISVLGQIDFRSIAIAFAGGAKLEWYLKAWGKHILSNDPRFWASISSRAMIESRYQLDEETISSLLADLYVPRARLANGQLRNWFSETDAWWMDNLRLSVDRMADEALRTQALYIGLQTGDYALSFDEASRDLKRSLATVFWRLAGRFTIGPVGQPGSRSYNLPVDEFASQARADLFYLNLPAAHAEMGGSESRMDWRESWIRSGEAGAQDIALKMSSVPQSKQTYLLMIDRILRSAAHIRRWAIECQEAGLASAQDVSELVKDHRPVRATYSKDLTEVAGGLRNYVIVAERT